MGIFWKMCHQITLITLLTSTLHLKLAHYWKIWKLIQIYSTTTSLVYIWIEYYSNVGGGGIRLNTCFTNKHQEFLGLFWLGWTKNVFLTCHFGCPWISCQGEHQWYWCVQMQSEQKQVHKHQQEGLETKSGSNQYSLPSTILTARYPPRAAPPQPRGPPWARK